MPKRQARHMPCCKCASSSSGEMDIKSERSSCRRSFILDSSLLRLLYRPRTWRAARVAISVIPVLITRTLLNSVYATSQLLPYVNVSRYT